MFNDPFIIWNQVNTGCSCMLDLFFSTLFTLLPCSDEPKTSFCIVANNEKFRKGLIFADFHKQFITTTFSKNKKKFHSYRQVYCVVHLTDGSASLFWFKASLFLTRAHLLSCFPLVFQWEDSLEFIQPLAQLPSFDHALFQYLILKHKYLELLCIKVRKLLGTHFQVQ
jgi:hypothetical protein